MLILNVDDDSDDREFFSDAVREVDPNIPCMVFDSGNELLKFLENSPTRADYIFIDINMPKMNGYECAQEIKAHYLTDDMNIIMYSTAFNPADLLKFDEEGFKYVVKQNSLADLVESIQKVINPQVSRQEERR